MSEKPLAPDATEPVKMPLRVKAVRGHLTTNSSQPVRGAETRRARPPRRRTPARV